MTEQLTADELAGLRELLDKEAIREVLAVASRGIDRVAGDLLATAYHEQSVDYHGGYTGPGHEFATLPGRSAPENLMAHHALAQSLIEVDGATAYAETYFVANFERFAKKRNEVRIGTMMGRYLDRLDKVEGRWRLSVRKVLIDSARESSQGDAPPGAAGFPRGQRWPDDEVFRIRDLVVPESTS